ncbi:MAG: PASTA domain-containing protein [Candidatus Cloacimonadaceae bacterium]
MNSKVKLWGYYFGIGLGIIIVTAFVTSQLLMPFLFGRPKSIEVPNVMNIASSQASSILIRNKLHGIVKDSIWSDELDNGIVLSQKPEAGELIKPDGSVYLVISRGSRYVKVPNLIGQDVQAAWLTLKNNELGFTVADSVNSEIYSANMVVQTVPDRGERVLKNSKIKLYISKGRAYNYETPDVIEDFNY